MTPLEKEVFFIASPAEVTAARRQAKKLALAIGFSEVESEHIALVATELGSNLHKHATQGVLSLTPIDLAGRKGVQVDARDKGPGIPNQDQAFADGFSTVGTLGDGLGAVNRMMDTMEVFSEGLGGTHISAQKWLWNDLTPTEGGRASPFDVGAASRAHPGMTVNGDSFIIKHWEGHTLVSVIDGVGHGQFAHKASSAARKYIETHYRQNLDELFMGTARACRGTRGAVMAIAVFDWDSRHVHTASVGNIEAKIHNAGQSRLFSVRRGIVGFQMPKPRVTTEVWAKGGILVLHSDGMDPHWQWKEVLPILHNPAATIARRLLCKYSKDHDDTTVLVLKDRQDRHG